MSSSLRKTREVHSALVVDNNDPDQRGRLRLSCETLLGSSFGDGGKRAPRAFVQWIEPMFDKPGIFIIPNINTEVELELSYDEGDGASPGVDSMTGSRMRWRGSPYSLAQLPHLEFRKNYPSRTGYVSPGGKCFILADDSISELIFKFGALKMGGDSSDEPVPLGNVLITMLNTMLNAIATHIHATNMGPTSPPTNAAVFSQLAASPVGDRALVSDYVFAEKGTPNG